MYTYTVKVPFAGHYIATVESEEPLEDIDAFYEVVNNFQTFDDADHYEWESYEALSEGNILYPWVNTYSVELEDG